MQFSLRTALAATAVAGVACTALVYANLWWGSAFLSLALTLVGLALLGVTVARGEQRAAWAGCLIFCGGYLLLVYGWRLDRYVGPALITTKTLAWLQPKVQRTKPVERQIFVADQTGRETALNAVSFLSELTIQRADQPLRRPLPQWEPFQQVGHGLVGLTAGAAGAAAAVRMSRRRPNDAAGAD